MTAAVLEVTLSPEEREATARRVAELLAEVRREDDRWMTTREAAEYAGCSVDSLHRAMAAREVQFAQDAPGAKAYFKRSHIDRWRQGG